MMMGFLKRLVRKSSHRRRRVTSRCASVRATIKPGDTIVAGDCTVETLDRGGLLIRVGGDLVIVAKLTDRADKFLVCCYSTGGRVPRFVSTAENAEFVENFKPVKMNPRKWYYPVRLGPGGAFVQDWPGDKIIEPVPSNPKAVIKDT